MTKKPAAELRGTWAGAKPRGTVVFGFVDAHPMKNAAKVVKNPHMYKSTEKKVSTVREIVEEWYEPGRQDRCKLWVYRNKIQPLMGISERTFFRCLRRETEVARDEQPTLFDFMDEPF